jgi:hypothetical protein
MRLYVPGQAAVRLIGLRRGGFVPRHDDGYLVASFPLYYF